jgi:transcriptional repressor NrdR
MRCPYCPDETRVVDSRAAADAIRRRRECRGCGRRFTTYERVADLEPAVVKRDGRREPFLRDKLVASIRLACVKRPVSYGDVEAIAETVRTRVMQSARAEVSSQDLGTWVLERLLPLDEVAAFRFASVFRRPDDVEGLRRELAALEATAAKTVRTPSEITQPALPGMRASGARRNAGGSATSAALTKSPRATTPREAGD